MKTSLISILIPFKNTEAFLAECLDSIESQTYQSWELIAINDHSTDSSLQLVEQYAKKDKRIQVYNNIGNGVIEALRMAYSKSKGSLITRMDSDDIMHADKLQIMNFQLQEHGKGHISLGLVKYFSANGINNGYERYEQWLNKLTREGNNYSEIYKECVIPSPCWMVHRDDFITSGAFDSDRYPEDYDLTFRFYKHGLKCLPSTHLLHYWRDYDTRSSRTDEHYALNYLLNIKIEYFLELDHDSSRPLTVWGAGTKGKTVAKAMVDNNVPFYWICDNPKKIGQKIYGQTLLNFDYLSKINRPQSIITVANQEAQVVISRYLHKQQMRSMIDYFFFC